MKPPNSGGSGKSADSIIYDEIECAKDEIKFPKRTLLSPRSSLTCTEADLILKTLAAKVNSLVTKLHKDFNPIAQGTSFYLKKNPAGEMIDYLSYLNWTTLNSNHYVLAEAVRIFGIICEVKPAIIHEQTIHRLLGCCCLLAGKFYYDGYNPKGFEKILGVRKNKLASMENYLFMEVLGCSLRVLTRTKVTAY